MAACFKFKYSVCLLNFDEVVEVEARLSIVIHHCYGGLICMECINYHSHSHTWHVSHSQELEEEHRD